MAQEFNPRPGACVCVARWDGEIVYNNPRKYDALTQGDTPAWLGMIARRDAKQSTHKRPRQDRERRAADGSHS